MAREPPYFSSPHFQNYEAKDHGATHRRRISLVACWSGFGMNLHVFPGHTSLRSPLCRRNIRSHSPLRCRRTRVEVLSSRPPFSFSRDFVGAWLVRMTLAPGSHSQTVQDGRPSEDEGTCAMSFFSCFFLLKPKVDGNNVQKKPCFLTSPKFG